MGKTFRYFDENWKNEILTCPECGWRGTFDDGLVEVHEYLVDSTCPDCDWMTAPILAKLLHMTLRDAAENLEKLTDFERQYMVGQRNSLATNPDDCLKNWYELPEIDAPSIKIMWHFMEEDGELLTVLLYDNEELWREKAIYGGRKRFSEVAAILKFRYGDHLADLVPTEGSVNYLFGSDLEFLVCVDIDEIRSSIKVGHKRYLAEYGNSSSSQPD